MIFSKIRMYNSENCERNKANIKQKQQKEGSSMDVPKAEDKWLSLKNHFLHPNSTGEISTFIEFGSKMPYGKLLFRVALHKSFLALLLLKWYYQGQPLLEYNLDKYEGLFKLANHFKENSKLNITHLWSPFYHTVNETSKSEFILS